MRPETEEDLSAMVAKAADGKRPLVISGGGTRQGLGHPVVGEQLDTGGVSGITLYEPGALTIVARAGTTVAEVEAALESEGQQLSFEPSDLRGIYGTTGAPTIGGAVAVNASGPRRIQAGACRDSLLGVRFVDGRGQVIKNGGRVMKNVTGYDLVKLMAGSHGTLGVLSEVSLKVLPKAEARATIAVDGTNPSEACAAMSAALGSPFDVTGAAYLAGEMRTIVRIEGFEGSVAYRGKELQALLGRFGEASLVTDKDPWTDVRDAKAVQGDGDIWRISVKPTDGAAVLAAVPHKAALLDWGGGLVWLRVAEGTDVRAALSEISGHATLLRASDETKAALSVFQPETATLAKLSAGIRAQFDPAGILNAGRMG